MADTSEREHKEQIEDFLASIRGEERKDPEVHPPWGWKEMVYYLCWMPISWSLTLYMCVVGFVLAGYGWYRLKRQTGIGSVEQRRDDGEYTKGLTSIVIPCFNESKSIQATLLSIERNASDRSSLEVICVDGGSSDEWPSKVEQIKSLGLLTVKTSVISSERSGRGICLEVGVKHAKGEVLVFLHADAVVSKGFDVVARQQASDPRVVLGSWQFAVNRSLLGSPVPGLGTMELFARIRNHFWWLPYGDQGYFIHREMYNQIGGFPQTVLLEDLQFTANARKFAVATNRIIYIDSMKVFCSPRRWQKNGVFLNTMWNQIIVACYSYLNYTPRDCYKLYYGVYPDSN